MMNKCTAALLMLAFTLAGCSSGRHQYRYAKANAAPAHAAEAPEARAEFLKLVGTAGQLSQK